jgi:hypothetical protein
VAPVGSCGVRMHGRSFEAQVDPRRSARTPTLGRAQATRRSFARHNVPMVVDPPLQDASQADLPAGAGTTMPDDRSRVLAARLRSLLVWAGLVTLVAMTLLAAAHLVADVWAVRVVRIRLIPVVLLSVAGLGLALLVAWLAGATRRREILAVAIGFAVLVAVRVFVSAEFDGPKGGEPGTYAKAAASLLTPEWDLIGRPMGYTLALAGSFVFTPDRQLATEVLNLLLAILAGAVVLGMARGLYGPRTGALALLGYAVWPAAALMTVVSIPQIAFDLAVVAAAWVSVATPPGWRGGALMGALLGASQYLRPTAPFLMPAYILARLWPGGSWRTLVGAVVVPIIAFLVVLMPVVIYNLDRTGSPSISTSDYGGHVLYQGTYEPSGGTFSAKAHRELVAIAGPDPLDWGRVGTEIAFQRIREDPIGMVALGIRKQDTLWGTEHYGVQYGIDRTMQNRPAATAATVPMLLSQGFYVLVLLSAAAGLWLRRRQPDALVPLAITMVWIVSALHAVLEVRDRHHSYVIPLLLPLSALAFARAYEWAGGWAAQRRASAPT